MEKRLLEGPTVAHDEQQREGEAQLFPLLCSFPCFAWLGVQGRKMEDRLREGARAMPMLFEKGEGGRIVHIPVIPSSSCRETTGCRSMSACDGEAQHASMLRLRRLGRIQTESPDHAIIPAERSEVCERVAQARPRASGRASGRARRSCQREAALALSSTASD